MKLALASHVEGDKCLVARQVGDPEHTKEVIVTAKTRWDSPPSLPWRCELAARGRLAYDCAQW